mmetsp:Transcript_13069/g.9474  ORF Transcript_13069/g.9474 Transcript_13069/m.9474 type:complete len:80 (+) Transcript_13069:421-660(+)
MQAYKANSQSRRKSTWQANQEDFFFMRGNEDRSNAKSFRLKRQNKIKTIKEDEDQNSDVKEAASAHSKSRRGFAIELHK